jgi:hypothetical protein
MPNEPRYVLSASDQPESMGDTLLKYARPIFERLPQDHTFAELKAMMVFAGLVWNIGLLHDVSDAVAYLATKMPRRLRLRPPQALAVIRPMLTRKDLCFPGDGRAALNVEVERIGLKFHVRAVGINEDQIPDPSSQDCELCEMQIKARRRRLH